MCTREGTEGSRGLVLWRLGKAQHDKQLQRVREKTCKNSEVQREIQQGTHHRILRQENRAYGNQVILIKPKNTV